MKAPLGLAGALGGAVHQDDEGWALGAEALVEARDLDQCVGDPPP
jgi:hypothetical protein